MNKNLIEKIAPQLTEPVGMPVDLTARPVVSVEGMRGLERKLLCQSDHCHIRKDIH